MDAFLGLGRQFYSHPRVLLWGKFQLGVANLVGLATETTEISEFFLKGTQ